MNKVITVSTVVALLSGCSSLQHVSTVAPADQHQAAKTRYYEDLSQGQYRDEIHTIAELDTEFQLASTGTANERGQ